MICTQTGIIHKESKHILDHRKSNDADIIVEQMCIIFFLLEKKNVDWKLLGKTIDTVYKGEENYFQRKN